MAFYPTHRDVPIAEYPYRHEAEFAAGFLEDAGIPFRLQTDDAGGADSFMTIARPARLWVRKEDVLKAREVLDIDDASAAALSDARPLPASSRRIVASGTALSGRERLVAGTLGIVFLAVGLGTTPLVLSTALTLVSFALAMGFGIAAVFGHTIGPLRVALRVLSGHVP